MCKTSIRKNLLKEQFTNYVSSHTIKIKCLKSVHLILSAINIYKNKRTLRAYPSQPSDISWCLLANKGLCELNIFQVIRQTTIRLIMLNLTTAGISLYQEQSWDGFLENHLTSQAQQKITKWLSRGEWSVG